jgi:glycosyltransferase involved in cell wall biosynthesis
LAEPTGVTAAEGTAGGAAGPPLVSVVVPVWNREHHLDACLESLLAQTHPLVEVIVVDDGSTDRSAAVAEAHAGVRVLRRAHEGLPATRNAGIDASTGSLVGFCDSDDVWHPEKAERQVRHLAENPGCDVVLCRQVTFFDEGVPHPDWLRPDLVRGDLDGVSTQSGLFRRHVFAEIRYQDDVLLGEGFDLIAQVRWAGFGIDVLEERLWGRRIHGRSLMDARSEDAEAGMFRSIRKHLRAQRPAEDRDT